MACAKIQKNGKEYFIELPQSELQVLEVLAEQPQGTIVPRVTELLRNQGSDFSDASIYSFAKRLKKKNLVKDIPVDVPVIGASTVRRIIWERNFDRMESIEVLSKLPE